MTAAWLVPAFDPVEDGPPRLGRGLYGTAVDELALDARADALVHRLVVDIDHGTHRIGEPAQRASFRLVSLKTPTADKYKVIARATTKAAAIQHALKR